MDRFTALQVFVNVVDLGSLAAAANKLDMSRAMATRYVSSLEEALGARLLRRTNRSLGPTEVGSRILAQSREIVALADEIETIAANSAVEPSGKMRVASSGSFAQCYLAEAVSRFAERFPKTSVELVVVERPVNLFEERIDLEFSLTREPDPKVVARRLAWCELVLCAAPTYASRCGLPSSLDQLAAHNCLVHTFFAGSWSFVCESWLDSRLQTPMVSVPVSGNLTTNDTMVLLKAAQAGRGIACLPMYAARDSLDAGTLVRVLPQHPLVDLGIFALYPSRRHLPLATRAMMEFVSAELGNRTNVLQEASVGRASTRDECLV